MIMFQIFVLFSLLIIVLSALLEKETKLCYSKNPARCKCPEEYQLHLLGRTCMAYVYVEKTWTEARDYCHDIGGALAKIMTKEENDFVGSLIKKEAWIGLNDRKIKQGFRWTDGSKAIFVKWKRYQPDGGGTWSFLFDEDCVELTLPSYEWNDIWCNSYRPFVCQTDALNGCENPSGGKLNNQVHWNSTFLGDTATYDCLEGYAEVSGDHNRTCLANGTWTGQPLKCEEVTTAGTTKLKLSATKEINPTVKYGASSPTINTERMGPLNGTSDRYIQGVGVSPADKTPDMCPDGYWVVNSDNNRTCIPNGSLSKEERQITEKLRERALYMSLTIALLVAIAVVAGLVLFFLFRKRKGYHPSKGSNEEAIHDKDILAESAEKAHTVENKSSANHDDAEKFCGVNRISLLVDNELYEEINERREDQQVLEYELQTTSEEPQKKNCCHPYEVCKPYHSYEVCNPNQFVIRKEEIQLEGESNCVMRKSALF